MDFIGPADDRQLKQVVVNHAIRSFRHVVQISAATSDHQLGDCFRAAGFIRLRQSPLFFRYEKKPSDAKWFIMAGDSDGEFLQAGADFCERGVL